MLGYKQMPPRLHDLNVTTIKRLNTVILHVFYKQINVQVVKTFKDGLVRRRASLFAVIAFNLTDNFCSRTLFQAFNWKPLENLHRL